MSDQRPVLFDQSLKELGEVFSLGSYGRIGGAHHVIERGVKLDKALRQRINEIKEMISTSSIQKRLGPLIQVHSETMSPLSCAESQQNLDVPKITARLRAQEAKG